jgi:transposase-like protein
VKQQLRDLKTCPLCGSTLSPILSGSGVRNRKRCSRCNRTFI